jgi:hypothetical protein
MEGGFFQALSRPDNDFPGKRSADAGSDSILKIECFFQSLDR